MKYFSKKATAILTNRSFRAILFSLGLYIISHSVFADDGTNDLLAGTTAQAIATINGSGRYWAYLIDGAISLAAFAKTKNPFVFASVLAVALAITLIVKMAGGTA